ncbi:MAG TPA: hypothetical protein VN864_07340 [Thermoplasmata archaeon]|nr:hypothetical protein [Thermoplasmata archaeon]
MIEEAPPGQVALPRPVDRRLHLGPFPSARDALKFAGFACAGLVAVPLAGPLAVLPFAALGFLVAVHRRDGRSLDERVTGYLGWQWRRRTRTRGGSGSASPASARLRTMRVGSGRIAAVLRSGGVPVAYLPPADARALFEATRQWLASLDGPVYLVARSEPLSPATLRPPAPAAAGSAEGTAQDGYRDVVELLVRRRRTRSVALVLWEPADRAGAARLEVRLNAASASLRVLGVDAERLTGRALRAELDRLALLPERRP